MEKSGLKSSLEYDLCIMMVLTLLLALVVAVIPSNFIRVLLGLPFLLFFPGYGLIAALFPRKTDLEGIERVALSFGLSIAVVPLIGLVLNYTPWGIRLYPILTTVALFIFITTQTHLVWSIFWLNLVAIEGGFCALREFNELSSVVRDPNRDDDDASKMAKLFKWWPFRKPMFWVWSWAILSVLVLGAAFIYTWVWSVFVV